MGDTAKCFRLFHFAVEVPKVCFLLVWFSWDV